MPELPEVETIRLGLEKHALGHRVSDVAVLNSAVLGGAKEGFAQHVAGRFITGLERKGKALAMTLDARNGKAPVYLLVRLGMTGQFTVEPCDAPLRSHTHVRMSLDDGRQEIRYRDVRRFGRLRCCSRQELEAIFRRLGPDAPQIGEAQFLQALEGRKGAIKSWLMNQQLLSGIGNIYADEALYLARIHPLTRAGRLSPDEARRLHRAVKKVLAQAVAMRGTSFRDFLGADGRPGEFLERLRVYQRDGELCHRCKTKIRGLVVAGRSSHFCPRCQPRPRKPAKMRGPR